MLKNKPDPNLISNPRLIVLSENSIRWTILKKSKFIYFFRGMHVFYRKIVSLIAEKIYSLLRVESCLGFKRFGNQYLLKKRFLFMIFRLRFIGFLLLVTTMLIGCGVLFNFNRVMRLDPVVLTQDDLPTMRLMENKRLDRFPEESSILVGCEQRWNVNQLNVRYYLFHSEYTAQKVWKNAWGYRVAGPASFDPELNPENIIGDATWNFTPKRHTERINDTEILFVKHNVAVLIRANGHPSKQLQFAREVARKIEAKITAVLEKK